MVKWPITYKNYENVEVTETMYFNLTQAECVELDLKFNGLENHLGRLSESGDKYETYRFFKELILASYGEKTTSGKFVKNRESIEAFAASEAFSEFIFSLLNNTSKATEFFNSVIPKVATPEEKKNSDLTYLPNASDNNS